MYLLPYPTQTSRHTLYKNFDWLMDSIKLGKVFSVVRLGGYFRPSSRWNFNDHVFQEGIPCAAAYLAARIGKKRVLEKILEWSYDDFVVAEFDNFKRLSEECWKRSMVFAALYGAIAGNKKKMVEFLIEKYSGIQYFSISEGKMKLFSALKASTQKGYGMIEYLMNYKVSDIGKYVEAVLCEGHGLSYE